MKNIRRTVETLLREGLEATGFAVPPQFDDEMVLLDCGLDSLGFAILITKLENTLGYDPFTLMDEPFYPRTFDEFVAIYEKYWDRAVEE